MRFSTRATTTRMVLANTAQTTCYVRLRAGMIELAMIPASTRALPVPEARHHDHRSYKSSSKDAAEGTTTWRAYLLDLRRHMEMNYNLEESFFTPHPTLPPTTPSPIDNSTDAVLAISTAAINLTIYHLLQLTMLADIPALETSKCCEDCQDLGLATRMRQWASGPDGRRAVVHAAQLRRIHGRMICTVGYRTCPTAAQRRISNPLKGVGLFYGAVVLCSFAHRAACAHDVGAGPQPAVVVELVQLEVGGQRLLKFEATLQW
ncbi:hypothetical protein VMCG_02094 [Cytospora schulzeri]|uniref:Uncharacterized protein n=1 Tax=Cytospora schulzeri TaxID=448051 RepID=A0A423X2T6_9PEZI|nr:hypothetical protein VMCG_02094 [Valsa malicola]